MLLVGMSKSSSGSPGTLEMRTQGSSPVNLVFERRTAGKAKVEPGWKVASGRRSYESVPMTDRGPLGGRVEGACRGGRIGVRSGGMQEADATVETVRTVDPSPDLEGACRAQVLDASRPA